MSRDDDFAKRRDDCRYCEGSFLCSYHEGWGDAMDVFEDALTEVKKENERLRAKIAAATLAAQSIADDLSSAIS